MILVIGYGSTLRTDDAVGPVVVEALRERFDPLDVRVLTAVQLLPEHAVPISRADHVVFIDANADLPVGRVRVDPIAIEQSQAALTHHVSPESLLRSADIVYGRRPPAQMVSIGAASFELGLALSPELRAQVPSIVAQAEAVVQAALSTLGGAAAV